MSDFRWFWTLRPAAISYALRLLVFVYFVYARGVGDAPKSGGTAQRLSSPRGEELPPLLPRRSAHRLQRQL
jgi:hypothetical protein